MTVPAPIEPQVQFGGGSDRDVLVLRKVDQRWFPRALKSLMDLVFGAAVVQSGAPTDTHVWTYDAASGGCKFKAAPGGTTSLSGDVTGTTAASVVSLVGGVAAATVAAQLPSAGQAAALAGTSGTPGSGNKYVTDGDARLPTAGEAAALAGTSGTPGSGNKYVTDADPRLAGTGSGAPAGAKIFMLQNFR